MAYLSNGEGWGARAFIPVFGRTLWVTTCEDGPQEGTLRWALTQAPAGPSVIKFRVGGVFALDYRRYNHLALAGGRRVFIDGFTAPEPVELQRAGLYFTDGGGACGDLVLRGLKIRPGEPGNQETTHGPGGERALTVLAESGAITRVLIDHCDLGWTTDDSFNVYGPGTTHVTLQWCLLAPGRGYRAIDAAPPPAPIAHKGTLLGVPAPPCPAESRWITIHHCLYAGFYQRSPLVFDCTLDFVNNVVAGWTGGADFGRCHVNIRGNAYLHDPAIAFAPPDKPWVWYDRPPPEVPNTMDDGSIYLDGNACTHPDVDPDDPWSLIGYRDVPGNTPPPRSWQATQPWGGAGVMRASSARAAVRAVLGGAGCLQQAKGKAWRTRDALASAAAQRAAFLGAGLF